MKSRYINVISFIQDEDGKIHEVDYTPTMIVKLDDLNMGWNKKNSLNMLKIFGPVCLVLLVVIIVYRRKSKKL